MKQLTHLKKKVRSGGSWPSNVGGLGKMVSVSWGQLCGFQATWYDYGHCATMPHQKEKEFIYVEVLDLNQIISLFLVVLVGGREEQTSYVINQ